MTTIDELLFRAEIEAFLYHEANLLDERCFAQWLELLADDLVYLLSSSRA
jgi:3-phenylpropionate/cinnamic acid dioxygenase small subunit